MAQGALLDLVCGPASPLPETYQRYRLVAHLGSGGQADVYRAVRLCGGVTSAPLTVKVFRVDPQRPLVDELRSWDKGDAVLMDLNNRGVAGIDGTVSTAVGGALAHGGPAFALMGDLTFLHDLTGLLLGDGERAPDLTVVVPDNDGGGIFAQLEPGADRYARDYRRVFGTPHGRDLVAVARGLGWAATRVTRAGDLAAVLALGGPRVVVVGTDQRVEAALAAELRSAAAGALA